MRSLDAQEYLNSFTNFESHLSSIGASSFNLQRVRRLFHVLGDPQKKLKFIHVAGTKGKGSTCAFAAYILRAAGYRVGLYTSPHLYHIHERIRVLDPHVSSSQLNEDFSGAISDSAFHALVKEFQKTIDRIRHDQRWGSLTYFEVLTGLALCHFSRRNIDVVVLETGLGGRLDATNAVDALVSGITPVSFDHTAQLGHTIAKIAAEKAAIIKEAKSCVVVAPQPVEAMKVIKDRCRVLGIKPFVVGKDIKFEETSAGIFSVRTPVHDYKRLQTRLTGDHQLQNAAMAVAMVELSGFKVSPDAVARGIRQPRWPARFEVIAKDPRTVVDCAHNTASARVLVETFRRTFPGKRMILILGLSGDKDIAGICRILGKRARLILTTQSHHPRAYHFSERELKAFFKDQPALNVKNVADALAIARETATDRDVILAAGSVFIAAEARADLRNNNVSI